MLRKNIYKWHRTCSLIIAIPVLLWASSGFLHPVMTSFRPAIATQGLTPVTIDSSKIKLSLQNVLQLNKIDSFKAVRFINIDTNWFYQLKLPLKNELVYISVINGKILKQGDWLYAQYLARLFLEGDSKQADSRSPKNKVVPSCCDAATICVLNPGKGAAVKEVVIVTEFDNVYQTINRLLPVYKVSFERADGIRIYVETAQSRFAFAADNNRAWFSIFFSLVHTWGWLAFLGKGKLFVEIFFAGLAFLTTLMGIYIFFSTKAKKANGNAIIKARRNHRFVSIIVSLFTLMFSFSGCYHAISKLKEDDSANYFVANSFQTSQINLDIAKLETIYPKQVSDIRLIKMNGIPYWQVFTQPTTIVKAKDLMNDKTLSEPEIIYLNTVDYSLLKNGDAVYAAYLATQFSKLPSSHIIATNEITGFTNEYNFADKLLPVWKVSYADNHNERYFIETTTGKLSKHINDQSLYQDYSFAFLHKHEFLGGFGKTAKDCSTMFWAFAQIVMVAIGLTLYFKWRKKNKS